MVFLSRYTANGQYPALAKKLAESLKRWDLPCDVQPVKDPGSWTAAVCAKPGWILQALFTYRQTVVWIDADCELTKCPTLLLGTGADFAVYNFAAEQTTSILAVECPTNRLLSGTGVLLAGYTAPAIELMQRWIHETRNEANMDAAKTDGMLDRAFNMSAPPVRPLWLPRQYNRMDSLWPEVEPVINHHFVKGALRDGEKQYD